MSNFYKDVISHNARYSSPLACNDLGLLEPGFRADVVSFIAEAKSKGHTLVLVETYRSVARQQMFYHKGLTKLKNVGMHHYGLAVDLALMDGGHYHADGQDYLFFPALARKHRMISGVDWGSPMTSHSFRDYDHLQRVPLRMQSDVISGAWYPAATYDPYFGGEA